MSQYYNPNKKTNMMKNIENKIKNIQNKPKSKKGSSISYIDVWINDYVKRVVHDINKGDPGRIK